MLENRIVTIHAVDNATFSLRKLERYVGVMRALGYRFVTVNQILTTPPLNGRLIALTVDDAYRTSAHTLLPLLKRLDVPALLFVPTGLLGREADDAELLRCECYPGQATMSADEVDRWLEAGLDVGFHTHRHLDLYHAAGTKVIEDDFLAGMRMWRERGWPVRHFAYPKGYLPRDRAHFENLLRGQGFAHGFTINWGAARASDGWYVNRVCLGNGEPLLWSVLKTLGVVDFYFRRRRLCKEMCV